MGKKRTGYLYVRKGFRQIYDYCGDYNQTAGYLLIFNCSDFNLVLTTAQQGNWPPRIHLSHRTIFHSCYRFETARTTGQQAWSAQPLQYRGILLDS
jgi:hypothetical protein